MLFCLAYITEYVTHESGRIARGYSAVVSIDPCFRFGSGMWLIMCFLFWDCVSPHVLLCVFIAVIVKSSVTEVVR